jgi:predicted CXXCH cytochrome family protein
MAILLALIFVGGSGFVTIKHVEDQDLFCASCHSQPETAYFQRTQAATVVDLASQHHNQASTHCIDCHSGPGTAGRIGAMMVGAGDLLAYVTGTARQPAPLTVPISDANCLKCHGDLPATRDFNRHYHALLSRWQAIDKNAATCVDCHSSHTTNGTASLGFLEQNKTEQVCERCHAVAGR